MSLGNSTRVISTERITFRLDAINGRFSLYDILKNQFVIENASIAIQAPGPPKSRNLIYAGEDFAVDEERSRVTPQCILLVCRHKKFPIGLHVDASVDQDETREATLRIGFENLSQKAVGVRALFPMLIEPARDGVVDLGGVWSHGAMLRSGFDSGSDSSIEHFSKPDGTEYDSSAFTVLHNLYSQRNIALGFTTLQNQFSRFVASPQTEGMSLLAVCDCDDVRVEPGQMLWSERLWIRVSDDPNAQIARYLDLSARENQARPCPLDRTPVCWSTLHASTGPVDHEVIERNVDWLRARKSDLPLRRVVVDEGWQTWAGDWTTPDKSRFPDGLADIAAKIKAAGFEPGLWLSPFIVQSRSALAQRHPEWMQKDASGNPIAVGQRWGGACYALDIASESVLEWLAAMIKTVVHEWGYRYLNLDLLRQAIVDGAVRSNSRITRAQSYRNALRAIRDAAGEDVFLLASSAPLAASVGLVDSCRVVPDLAPVWEVASTGAGIAGSGRNTLVRAGLHGRWFYNDPGCLIVHASGDEEAATAGERDVLEHVAGAVGGPVTVSEDLAQLTEEELDTVRFLLPPLKVPAAVPRPFERHIAPNVCVLAREGGCVVILFNWDDSPLPVEFRLADFGLNKNLPYLIYDVKGQKAAARVVGEWTGRLLEPHSVRVFDVVAVPTGPRPALVGSTFHIGQGAAEVVSYQGSASAMDLKLRLDGWTGHSGMLTFCAPEIEQATVESASGTGSATASMEEAGADRLLRLRLEKIASPEVCVKIALKAIE